MRVAWVSAESMTEGAMGVTGRLDMVRELMARGHQVDVVCGASGAGRAFPDIPTHLIPTSSVPFAAWLSQWPRVGGRLDSLEPRPDVVVADFALLPPVARWARRRGAKVVLDVRSQPVEAGPIRTAVQAGRFRATLRLFAPAVDGVSAVSPELLADAARHTELPPERRLVWRAGCRWADRTPAPTGRPPGWPAELDGRFVAFYHGSLTAGRGVKQCVEALARCGSASPDLALVLLGSGASAEELRSLAAARGVGDRVFVLDPVAHHLVPAFIRAADVGLVPLPPGPTWEVNWPVKLAEYLSVGLPVVLTDIRPHRVVSPAAPFAFWCGSGSPQEIASGLLRAHAARARLPELGVAAAGWARARLGWTEPAEAFERLLRSTSRELRMAGRSA